MWHSASFGLSVVVGNWVVTLLERAGDLSDHVSGVAGGLVLAVGVVSRPLGGRFIDRPAVVQWSFVVGGAAVALMTAVSAVPTAVVVCAVAGFAAGIPFAPSFAGAQRMRPDAPAAAIGVVNMAAAATILVGTPLLGLAFSLPGDGRVGFAVLALLWAAAALRAHADRDRRAGPQPPQQLHELGPRQRHAAVGRMAAVVVQEDRRPAARDRRMRVVLDERELAVGGGRAPQRLAAAVERWHRTAGDVLEGVVRG